MNNLNSIINSLKASPFEAIKMSEMGMHRMERDSIFAMQCNKMIDIYISAPTDMHLTRCAFYVFSITDTSHLQVTVCMRYPDAFFFVSIFKNVEKIAIDAGG